MAQRMRINVGGTVFLTQSETLKTYPDTKLAKLNTKMAEYDVTDNTYYFDRDPQCFAVILNMYRLGELHFPKHVCAISMRKELEFWGVPQTHMSRCCWKTFYAVDEDMDILDTLAIASGRNDYYLNKGSRSCRERMWLFLDDPSSSTAAKIWAYFYLFVVCLSSFVLCLETLPGLRMKPSKRAVIDICETEDLEEVREALEEVHDEEFNGRIYYTYCYVAVPGLFYVGVVCVILFTAEVLLGFLVCPSKILFFKTKLYVIAIITTIAMWLAIYFELNKHLILTSEPLGWFYGILKCISMLRILLFFRLARLFSSMNVLLLALKSSIRELVLLVVSIVLATLLFAMAMYQVELLHQSQMKNMFVSMWWAIITMSTVGYGDVIPETPQGKVLGSICAIFGLILLALPVAIVASNFADYYNRTKDRQRHLSNKCYVQHKIQPITK